MTISLPEAGPAPSADANLLGNVISSDASPTFFRADFRVEPGQTVSPGTYVAIEATSAAGAAAVIIARVEDMHEVNPHEDALSSTLRDVLPFEPRYSPEGSSTVIYRIARAEPLEQAILAENGTVSSITAVDTLAAAGANVYRADPELIVAALGMEPSPDDGFHVGSAYGDAATTITLNKSIIQRHVFIAGGIGSGKSYTRGVLAEELHAWGIPQVNIDINGEMTDAAVELGGVNLVPGRDGFTLPLSALSSADVVDAVPSINKGTNMETLLRFAHESLAKQVQNGRRRHFGVDDLVEHIDDCAKTLEITSKATVEPTKLRTGSLNRLTFLGQPYDWVGKLQPGAFVNIDCRSLSITELRLIAASVARDLQSLARQRAIPFTVLSIDEFHLVAPADDAAVTTQVLREIARVGRHYRLGLVLTTQSPADVDKSILKRLLTRFLHAIEPDQLTALRGVFSDASEDLIRTLPKLPQGTCIVTGAFETVRHATVIAVRPRRTTHGGATPDIWSDFAERGWTGKSGRASEQ